MARVKEALMDACEEVVAKTKSDVDYFRLSGYDADRLMSAIVGDCRADIPLCVVRVAQAHPVLAEYFGKPVR